MRIRPLGRVDTTTSLTTLTYIGLQLDPLDTIHATDEQQHSQHREAALTAEEVVEPRYVHPDSRRIYEAYGGKFAWTRYIPMFGAAIETFGPRLVFALNYTEFVSKGLGNYFLQSTFTPMFLSHFGCTAMQFQRYKNVATMGWSVKPFMALISDSFALFGYTKRWYMVISELGAAVCCIIYGLLPGGQSNAQTAAILTFIAGLGMANVDILTEGLYSREMRRHPAAGPQLVSSIWWMITLAQLITSFVEGPLANVGLEAIGAYIACGCLLLTIPVLAINWYGEKTNREERLYDLLKLREEERAEAQLKGVDAAHDELDVLAAKKNDELQHQPSSSFHVGDGTDELVGFSNEPCHNTSSPDDMEEDLDIPSCCFGIIEFNQEVLIRNWPITIYCILMCAGVIATAIVTVGGNQWALLAVCSSVSVVLGAMGFWALPLVIAKVNLFAFLNSALGVSVSGALTTWYLSGPDCVPGGPDFSYFFYMTTSSCISSAFSMVGVAAFSYIFSKRSYQLTFVVTSILGQLSSIFDLMIVERWNKDIGIPDKYVFICGDAMIGGVISMLSWMPMVVLLSQLCPRGSESIVYSLLAGYSNLGQTMATEAGTLIMEFLWSVQSEPPCDWSNLPRLLILTSFIIPLLSYPPIFLLVPRARICDEIDTDGNVIGVKGSNERAHDRAPTSTIEDESGEVEQKGAVALEDDAEVGDERISS